MNVIAVFTCIIILMGGLGLFMSGIAAMRQASLAKRMFQLRFGKRGIRDDASSE